MDNAGSSGQTGHVEPTPEARPLTPPTMRDHYVGQPLAGAQPQGPAATAGHTTSSQVPPEEIAREVAERLKPVAAAAEEVAAKALDFSAKGLTKLAGKLEERRRQRGSEQR
jgi:hypothetical protein